MKRVDADFNLDIWILGSTTEEDLEAEKNNGDRYHETVDQDQEAEMESPIPLELAKIALWRFLVVNLKLFVADSVVFIPALQLHLHLPQLLRG